MESKLPTSFNNGHVGIVSWNLASPSSLGYAKYSWKSLLPKALPKITSFANGIGGTTNNVESFQVIATFTDEENIDSADWTHGCFSLDEYKAAQSRASGDLSYDHKFGLQFTKVIDRVLVGSCLASGEDVLQLKRLGVTAVLNLQTDIEQVNWEIDKTAIKNIATENNITIANCPIRDVDAVDLRRKLPLAVATLYRMLRLGNQVYVTCTTGLDRSPACVIGYLHWIQDIPLQTAVDLVTKLHLCALDRPALVWATWDILATLDIKNQDLPTHAVQIVWNHGCKDGEDVVLVGDFKGEWNEPMRMSHVNGPKYAVDLRVTQGKYHYKFIVGGQWRHSHGLPNETDQWGNVNNVIVVGGRASTRFDTRESSNLESKPQVRVIERPLSEEERYAMAFAMRRLAFSVCPLRLVPKQQH